MKNNYVISLHKDSKAAPTLYRVEVWEEKSKQTLLMSSWMLYKHASKLLLELSKVHQNGKTKAFLKHKQDLASKT